MNDFHERIAKLSPQRLALLALDLKSKLDTLEQAAPEPIAIIGMACRFPGADSPEAFWELLREGRDLITEVPPDRWDVEALYDPDPETPGKMATRWGCFLRDVDRFDAGFFGIAPREAMTMDPQQRLLLEVAWAALENAAQPPDRLGGSATGVFVGLCGSDYFTLLLGPDRDGIDAYLATGNAHSVASGRLSYSLGLQGPSVSLDTACSSSLVAVHLACQSLRTGDSRMALAGAVNVLLSADATITLSKARMMAPDGRCKAFDASANGFVRGEGCAVLVLKRLADAVSDGDRIHAVIRGSAVNQDGRSSGLTAPNGPAQEAVIGQALTRARVAPRDVAYVEAHGTGTALGDPIEVRALGAAFGDGRPPGAPLLIGSVKTNVGHLESAAGMAGLLKVVLALTHGAIPPTLHVRQLNPHVEWAELPLRVVTELTPWPAGDERRLAGVSSFGFSGTNAHVIIEEAPAVTLTVAHAERPWHLLTLSAKSKAALRALAAQLRTVVATAPSDRLVDICCTANAGREHFAHRLALWGQGATNLGAGLGAVAEGRTPPLAVMARVKAVDPPEIAFLFTGQGSQYPGMGRQLYETQPVFRAALQQCDAIATRYLDEPLLAVLYPANGDGSRLDETAYTQLALFALEYALCELWRSWGIQPTAVAGHSVGEYVAACVAGVLGLDDALKLVATRGRLMQALPRDGMMVAAFAPEATVARALTGHHNAVTLAAVNGPANVVISGRRAAVEAVVRTLEAEGVVTRQLAVSHAFHSPLMDPMLDEFERVAGEIPHSAPRIGLVSNVTGRLHEGDPGGWPSYWRRHVREPVRFSAMVETLHARGYRILVEIGPTPVLSDLARQCMPETDACCVPSLRRGHEDWRQLLSSLAAVYVAGAAVDWRGFHRDQPWRPVTLPTYPFQRQRYWALSDRPRFQVSSHGDQHRTHPLLGHRVHTPAASAVFDTRLSLQTLPFLHDHRIQGRIVLPAPCYLEIALAGAAAIFGSGPIELAAVTIQAPIVLGDDEVRTAQWIARREGAESASFDFHSFQDGDDDETSWTCHASGRVRLAAADVSASADTSGVDTVRARCVKEITADDFYADLRERGVAFGPRFRGVRRLWRRDGESLGHIVLPEDLRADAGAYVLHPALLDAGLQTLGAGLPGREQVPDAAYLMIGIERLRVVGSGLTELWAHATLRDGAGPAAPILTADLRLLDSGGRLVAELEGIQLRRTPRETSLASGKRFDDWLYEVAWRVQSHGSEDALSSRFLPEPRAIIERVEAEVPALRARHGLEEYGVVVRELDTLATAYAVRALEQFGWEFEQGSRISLASPTSFPVRGHRTKILRRVLTMLEEDGLLQAAGPEWEVVSRPGVEDPGERARALAVRFPAYDAELTLVTRCGERLVEVLRGDCDPLQLLFPDGSTAVAERLAQDSPPARACNALVQSAFAMALASVPEGRPLRVLEIGAGTGGTTTGLLPLLPAQRTEYVFTDVSRLFLARARDKYAGYPFVRYEMLDIEADPASQGFAAHAFDLVLAANVLHATRDLRESLAHVKHLLAPAGLLLLLEGTAQQRWVDLTYGLTAGWWRFTDTALRPSHPLLSAPAWRDVLVTTGFSTAAAVPNTRAFASQAVIIARGPDDASAARDHGGEPGAATGEWLIIADEGGVGERVSQALAARGRRGIVVAATDAVHVVDSERVSLDVTDPAAFERLIADASGPGRAPLRGVVHLLGLDAVSEDGAPLAALQATATRLCRSALYLVQALAKAVGAARPRLWLVTRGAQPAAESAGRLEVAQSTLWGLGRVAAMEHPEIWGGLIDLNHAPAESDVSALLAELLDGDGEDQVALRPSGRHVARLVRARASRAAGEPAKFRADATYLITGGFGGMGVRVARWMVEAGARHLAVLGRRPPSPAARAALDHLASAGTELVVEQGNVGREADLARVLAEIAQRMPPLRGVVHAAGTFDDRVLLRQDWERFARVLESKVSGAWNLHRLTRMLPLDFFVLFSSAASFLGPVGLGNYTAANAFLDALAHHRRWQGLPALSIDWGPWEQVGMAEAVGPARQSQWTAGGFGTMRADEALNVLGDLLQHDSPQIGVLPVRWSRFIAKFGSGREPRIFAELAREERPRTPTSSAPGDSEFRHRLEHAVPGERLAMVTALVRERTIRVLGFDASYPLDPQQRLFDVGMDSLTAIELKNQLQTSVGRSLPSTVVFDHPSVEALATYLVVEILGLAPAVSRSDSPPDRHPVDSGEDRSQLSEDELESLLAERLRHLG
jgi:acyl transferase domain-containing protein